MTTKFLLPVLLIAAAVATAQEVNYNIARDQAKRAVSQTQAASNGQGAAPAAGQTPPAQSQPAADPVLAATVQNINKLRDNLATISAAADANAAADEKVSLLNNLTAAAQGTKASSANVRKLASQIVVALPAHKKLSPQITKLARDVHAVFNGGHLNDTQRDALLAEVKKLLTDAEVSDDDTGKIVDTLKAVAAETAK
jgi:small-conductance mechanosensitive channel